MIWPPLECNQPGVRMDWGKAADKTFKVQVAFECAVPELRRIRNVDGLPDSILPLGVVFTPAPVGPFSRKKVSRPVAGPRPGSMPNAGLQGGSTLLYDSVTCPPPRAAADI